MKIAFDVDGVVLRSIDVILEYVNQKTGRDIKVDDLTTWDLEPLGLDLKTLWEAVDHLYATPKVEPYSRATQVLSRIYRITNEPLLFITGREDPKTAKRQLEALSWNSTMPEMVVCGGNRDKREYLVQNSVDFIVEDDVRHVDDYLKAGFGVGLMVRPWNRNTAAAVTTRFESWAEIEQWFLSVSRKYEKR